MLAICPLSSAQDALKKDQKRLVYALFDQLFELSEEVGSNTRKDSSEAAVYNPDYDMQFFGWHPNWLGDTYLDYDFSALTSVSYYSSTMFLDEYGQVAYEQDGWFSSSTETLIRMADEDSCNTLLTLRCDDAQVIATMLNDQQEMHYCVKYISDLVTSRENVEGLTISFEDMPFGYKEEFNSFVRLMKKSLDVFDRALVVAIPPASGSSKYDLKEINNYADQFVMLGYNYYYAGSKKAGPVSPLYRSKEWGDLNVQQAVSEYISTGVPRNKLIVAFPYYGAMWDVDSSLHTNKLRYTFKDHLRINQIWDLIDGDTYEYDADSVIAFYENDVDGQKFILFFDDHLTLKNKFKWVQSQNLAGVGMWALGYDDGSDKLWNMITNNFDVLKNPGLNTVINDSIPKAELPLSEAAAKANIIKIVKQSEVQIVLGITLTGFVVLGALLGLTSTSIFDRLLILDIRTYLKVIGMFLALMLLLIFIAGFVFHSKKFINEEHLEHLNLVTSESIKAPLTNFTIIGTIIITLFSWKAFVNFNKDVP
ncbi:MAG: hypothetical protein Crog4KO_23490 [Crocinitomicaceae bacterium]